MKLISNKKIKNIEELKSEAKEELVYCENRKEPALNIHLEQDEKRGYLLLECLLDTELILEDTKVKKEFSIHSTNPKFPVLNYNHQSVILFDLLKL